MGKKPERRKRRFFDTHYIRNESRRSYRMALILFWSVLLYFFFQHYVIGVGIVTDRSMLPNLMDGYYFLINKYIYHFAPPHRGDIVVLAKNEYMDEQYVKRVIAVPGDVLLIQKGRVFLNGKQLQEAYIEGETYPDMGPLWLGANAYFVMGDNRFYSEDSRHFGQVRRSDIEGKIAPGKLFSFK